MANLDVSSDISGMDDDDSKAIPRQSYTRKKPSQVIQIDKRDEPEVLPPIKPPSQKNVEEDKGSFEDRPIQLVKINPDIGKFQVCEQGLKILRRIEGNIGIIAFAGLYRTGKSFTLNLLLDKLGKGVLCCYHSSKWTQPSIRAPRGYGYGDNPYMLRKAICI